MMKAVPALASLVVLTGCARTVRLVDFEAGTVIHGKSYGNTLKITMPDGEVLKGNYGPPPDGGATLFRVDRTANTIQGIIGHGGGYYVLLTSTKPGSSLVMEAFVGFFGGGGAGNGEARTNDGRRFRVQVS